MQSEGNLLKAENTEVVLHGHFISFTKEQSDCNTRFKTESKQNAQRRPQSRKGLSGPT